MRGMVWLVTAFAVSPVQAQVIGTRAAGMGGAYVPIANDASSVWHNPAGLAWVQGSVKLSLSANAYSITRAAINDYFGIAGELAAEDRANADLTYASVSSYPSSLFNAYPLSTSPSNRHVVGLGVVIPQDDALAGGVLVRPKDQPMNLQYEFNNATREYVVGAGYGLRLLDSLAFGVMVGLSLYTEKYSETRNRASNGFDPQVIDVRTLVRTFDLTAASLVTSLGAQLKLGGFWLGATLWPSGVALAGQFNLRFAQTELLDGAGKQDTIEVAGDKATWVRPMSATVGLGYTIDTRFSASVQATWTQGDARQIFEDYDITNPYYDDALITRVPGRRTETVGTLSYALGLEYWITDWLPVRLGLFYNPDNQVEPTIPEIEDAYAYDVEGGQWLPAFDPGLFGRPYVDKLGATLGFGLLNDNGIGTDIGVLFTMDRGSAVGEGTFVNPTSGQAQVFYPLPLEQDFTSYTFAVFVGGSISAGEEEEEEEEEKPVCQAGEVVQ